MFESGNQIAENLLNLLKWIASGVWEKTLLYMTSQQKYNGQVSVLLNNSGPL